MVDGAESYLPISFHPGHPPLCIALADAVEVPLNHVYVTRNQVRCCWFYLSDPAMIYMCDMSSSFEWWNSATHDHLDSLCVGGKKPEMVRVLLRKQSELISSEEHSSCGTIGQVLRLSSYHLHCLLHQILWLIHVLISVSDYQCLSVNIQDPHFGFRLFLSSPQNLELD